MANLQTNTAFDGKELVKKTGIVYYNPNEERNYFAWPNVGRLSNGTLMVVASGYRLGHKDPYGAITASYSTDDGVTWTKPEVIFDSPLDDRDPNIFVEGDTIFIGYFTQWDLYRPDNETHALESCSQWSDYYYSVTAEEIEKYGNPELNGISDNYIISHDGGKTWQYGGKICAHTPKGVIKLQDGRYFYVTTHGVTPHGASPDVTNKIAYITSTNLTDWEDPVLLYDVSFIHRACEPTAYQTASGRIIIMLRSKEGFYQGWSDDNGKSFTALKLIDASEGAKGTPAHICQHSSGVLVMVYGHRTNPYGLVARLSYDNGETWTEVIRLAEQGTSWDLGYPSTIERKDGTLLTVWYACQDVSHRNTGIHYVIWSLPKSV